MSNGNVVMALQKAEHAARDLERLQQNPKDETALIMAYGELHSALFTLAGYSGISASIRSKTRSRPTTARVSDQRTNRP